VKRDFIENYYSMNPLLFKFREELITSLKDAIQVSKMKIASERVLPFTSIDKININDSVTHTRNNI
jgi:hypothetical protein